jgi:hypothetical protein
MERKLRNWLKNRQWHNKADGWQSNVTGFNED